MNRGVRSVVVTVAATTALLTSGCMATFDRVGETVDEPPTLPPLLAERPLWDASTTSGVSTVSSATLRGDTAVLIAGEKDGYRLAALDAATGATRWSINGLGELPGGGGAVFFTATVGDYTPVVGGPPEDLLVFVPYYRGSCEDSSGWCVRDPNVPYRKEQGVAALSGGDGSVRWMTPVPADSAGDDALAVSVVAADQHMVVATTFDPYDSNPSLSRTVVFDVTDGHQEWQAPDVVAAFLAADVVIGQVAEEHSQLAPGLGSPDGPSTVVALDAADGERRWDLARDFTWSQPMLAAGDVVAVRTDETKDNLGQTRVVDATTGREVAQLGETGFTCASDGQSLIACPHLTGGPADHLLTFDLHERVVRVSERAIPERGVSGVWLGRVFLGDAIDNDPRKQLLVDRSANVLTARLPGKLVTISDRYAIFSTGEAGSISMYAVTS